MLEGQTGMCKSVTALRASVDKFRANVRHASYMHVCRWYSKCVCTEPTVVGFRKEINDTRAYTHTHTSKCKPYKYISKPRAHTNRNPLFFDTALPIISTLHIHPFIRQFIQQASSGSAVKLAELRTKVCLCFGFLVPVFQGMNELLHGLFL